MNWVRWIMLDNRVMEKFKHVDCNAHQVLVKLKRVNRVWRKVMRKLRNVSCQRTWVLQSKARGIYHQQCEKKLRRHYKLRTRFWLYIVIYFFFQCHTSMATTFTLNLLLNIVLVILQRNRIVIRLRTPVVADYKIHHRTFKSPLHGEGKSKLKGKV